VRVGVDLVSIPEVRESIGLFGDRYTTRLFTSRELDDCAGDGELLAPRLAGRFAAKEAAAKVLRPGDESLPWRSIEIRRAPEGSIDLLLTGEALALADRQGLRSFAVSMSHDGAYATAVVIAN
jgi:holo-[acyl-carrier protein] synthase